MFKEDIQEATEAKEPFEFSYTKPWLDWYETINVSILYNQYNYLTLERRYGSCWWLVGHVYNKHLEKWERVDVGQISNYDIKRLVEWARFTTKNGHTINILTEIRTIDGILNPVDDFLKIMQDNEKMNANTIIIPYGATNGDVIKAMFPNTEIEGIEGLEGLQCVAVSIGLGTSYFALDWWDAPYKGNLSKKPTGSESEDK